MKILKGQCGFFESLRRALCHINFYHYRKSIGNPVSKIATVKHIWLRFWAEFAGIGDGV